MTSKRKYHAVLDSMDVWEALRLVGDEAHARLELQFVGSVVTPNVIVVRVCFHDPLTVADLGPVFVWQETLARTRKVDMAAYMHRLIWDAWSAYHASPWQWSRGMRKTNVPS